MSYLEHTKVILQGVLGNTALSGTEIFSTGFQIAVSGAAFVPDDTQGAAITSLIANAWSSSDMNLCSNAYLTAVTFVHINSSGRWVENVDGSYDKKTYHPGGGYAQGYASSTREFPTSVVTSLRTPRSGAHGRGRMYWPLPAEPPDSNGYYSNTAAGNRAGVVSTLFHNINTQIHTGDLQGRISVASKAGFMSPVTHIQVGNVHDVQRRRRDALTEQYQDSVVVWPY